MDLDKLITLNKIYYNFLYKFQFSLVVFNKQVMGDMMGGKSLKRDLETLEDDIRNLKRKDMLAKMDRNHYVNNMDTAIWGFGDVLDDLNLRLSSKIKILNGIIMKYDFEAAASAPRHEE